MNNISKVIQRQCAFQEGMNSNLDEMYLAIVVELGELVDSFGAFNWKPNKRDEQNIEIELIDMAVFAINLAFYNNSLDKPRKVIPFENDIDLVKGLLKLLHNEDYLGIAYSIFAHLPKAVDVITAKQALNQLRQDYGYREGSYHKNWGGREDNTYLEAMYGDSYEEVYNKLEEIHTDKFIGGTLVNVFD
jgi:hypothetical protein